MLGCFLIQCDETCIVFYFFNEKKWSLHGEWSIVNGEVRHLMENLISHAKGATEAKTSKNNPLFRCILCARCVKYNLIRLMFFPKSYRYKKWQYNPKSLFQKKKHNNHIALAIFPARWIRLYRLLLLQQILPCLSLYRNGILHSQ